MRFNFKQFNLENRRWVKLILFLFGWGILIGSLTVFVYPELMEQILASFAERFGDDPALDLGLAAQIFVQNLSVAVMAWIGGLILGILPVIIVLINGFILGYVVTFVISSSTNIGNDIFFLIVGLVPHGVIELPAFLLAAVLGLRLGLNWLGSEGRSMGKWVVLKNSAAYTFKYFFYVVVALAIAAVIEVFISGKLVSNY